MEGPQISNFPGGMAPQSPSYPTSMLVSILEFIHVKTPEYTKQTLDMLHKIIQKMILACTKYLVLIISSFVRNLFVVGCISSSVESDRLIDSSLLNLFQYQFISI